MKAILVPTDFSPVAQAAIDVAVKISKRTDGQIILLHVIEGPWEGSFNVEGEVAKPSWDNKLFELKLIETARTKLYRLADQLKEKGTSVIPVLRLGDPFHGIQTVINEQHADLIVMGTNGRHGYRDRPVGTNAEKVVRRSTCPVLAVSGDQKDNEFKSIVYPTMLRDEEESAIDLLKNTQKMFGALIHVVRINTPGLFEPDYKVLEKMSAFAKKMKLQDYSLNTYNDLTEESGIVQFSSSIKADLIVMGTHARTALSYILSGSITEDVVNHSSVPVLTCHLKLNKHKVKALPAPFNF